MPTRIITQLFAGDADNDLDETCDSLPKCRILVRLINRNSLGATSYLVFKTMTYLNSLKPGILSFMFEAVAKNLQQMLNTSVACGIRVGWGGLITVIHLRSSVCIFPHAFDAMHLTSRTWQNGSTLICRCCWCMFTFEMFQGYAKNSQVINDVLTPRFCGKWNYGSTCFNH